MTGSSQPDRPPRVVPPNVRVAATDDPAARERAVTEVVEGDGAAGLAPGRAPGASPAGRPEPAGAPAAGVQADAVAGAEPLATSPGRTPFERDMADLEVKFERALDALHMAFQPIVHARDYALFGYEALLRSGEPALPHPGAMLDAAERLNRTAKLGRVIRTKVAKIFSETDDSRGLMFVNLHALDLLDKALSSPFSPLTKIAHRVVLEVTERASLDGVSDVRFRVAELREMGFRIAIDDLGAGHSRMNLFTPLDTDFVKLDMSLVRGLDTHPMKQAFIGQVIALCREQNIQVIGEGVETQGEADALIALGCDLLQGYLIARPGPPFPDVPPPPTASAE